MWRLASAAILSGLAACAAPQAAAAEDPAGAAKASPPAAAGDHRPMNMSEPMATGMMKPGMTEGDVKKAADKRARQMQSTMKREEASMPATKTKP